MRQVPARTGRLWRGSLVLTTILFATGGGRGQEGTPSSPGLPPAEVILDRYLEATGMKAVGAQIHNRVSRGTLELGGLGLKGSITIYAAAPNKTYSVAELGGIGKMEEGTQGQVAWRLSALQGPQLLEGPEKDFTLHAATFNRELRWRECFKKAECVGVETLEGRPCYKLVLTPTEGPLETWYLDQETALLTKIEVVLPSAMGNLPTSTLFSDYREVDGLRLAFQSRIQVLMQELITKTESIEHNVELPADRFDPPAEIRALLDQVPTEQVELPSAPETPSPQAPPEVAWTPEEHRLALESFEVVWTTVRDKHWDPQLGGLNWQAVHDELRPKVEAAKTMAQVREVLQQMIGRLGQSHFNIIPAEVYAQMAPSEGREPGEGMVGLDLRVLDGRALVTSVDEALGQEVRPGWQMIKIRGESLDPVLAQVGEMYQDSTLRDLILRTVVLERLKGKVGDAITVEFRDGEGRTVERNLPLTLPRGTRYQLGNLPSTCVWLEARKLEGNLGYIAFNNFLDPLHLMEAFEKAVKSFMDCAGLLIDLRGNTGGLGAMVMGMAGWFVNEKDQWLGTMWTRETQLKLVVNPRSPTFRGPLAILIDGCSASAAEFFAGGLRDLGRARLFGTRTAGAALPSTLEPLPNGDRFQYAFADYLSRSGQRLEGVGVLPDEEVKLTPEALLQGRDPVMEAAIRWLQSPPTGSSQQPL